MSEVRLIDANALKKKIDEVQYTQEFCIEHRIDYSISMQMLGMIIENAPTVEQPTGEWIPITKRPMTDDEWEELSDEAKDYIDEDGKWFFDCPMPENGQNIIISTKWGVWGDTCEISAEGGLNAYYLEGQGDWDGVLAWMPMPEPYKKGEEE